MDLLFKLLFRKIPTTTKVEHKFNKDLADFERLRKVENSEVFKEYLELEQLFSSPAYKKRVEEIKASTFENTDQGKLEKEYKELKNKKSIQLYYEFKEKPIYVQYKNFLVLRGINSVSEISKDKWDEEYEKFFELEKTPEFVNFNETANSKEMDKLNHLEEVINSEDFITFKSSLKDPQRWEKSQEYKEHARFETFKKDDEIKFYLKENNSPRFSFFKEWELTFEDDFHGKELDKTKWMTSLPGSDFVWENELSYSDEKQAYVGTNNIHLEYGVLTINTKRESKVSSAWHPKQGFVQKDFEYTSGLICTKGLFSQQEGLFQAKIRSRGSSPLHHAFSLIGSTTLPTVCVVKTSVKKRYVVGQIFKQKGKLETVKDTIKGLAIRGGYYIFSLEWTSSELIWRINNFEVFRTNNTLPKEPLSLMLNSFVKDSNGNGDGSFDIDWVRVYKKI